MDEPSPITLRTIEPGELPALLELYRDLNPDDLPLGRSQSARIFQQLLASREIEIWVALRDEEIVASCVSITVPNLTRGGRPFVVVENVVTKLQHRNQGIGKRLLQHVVELSKRRDSYKVMLQSGSDKPATKRFYKSLGFRDDAKTAYVIKDDVPKVRY